MKKLQRIIAIVSILSICLSDIAVPLARAAVDSGASAHPQVASSEQKPVTMTATAKDPVGKLTAAALGLHAAVGTQDSANKRIALKVAKLEKKNYNANEDVAVTVINPDQGDVNVTVVDAEGKPADVQVQQSTDGALTDVQLVQTSQFKPGKYTVAVADEEGTTTKQDFTWGVLALNPDKAVYKPQEESFLSMAVLNENGDMVCDAKLQLDIIKPDGKVDTLSSDGGQIKTNDICHEKIFTLTPDYEAHYKVGGPGLYQMKLTAVTGNGSYSITDGFTVEEVSAFEIKRTSATRLYPPRMYPMNIEITANEDFSGVVTETVPESFAITPAQDAESYDQLQTVYEDKDNPETKLQKKVLGASDTRLRMPFDNNYPITQGFGSQLTDHDLRANYASWGLSGHDGIDFGVPMGTPLYAVDDGKVLLAGPGDYGTTIVIEHSWGRSYYGHLSEVKVLTSTTVTKGTLIGYSGNTGESTGPHLHFGIKPTSPDMNNGYSGKVDPMLYLPIGQGLPLSSAFPSLNAVLGASDSAAVQPTPTPEAQVGMLNKPASQPASPSAIPVSNTPLASSSAEKFTVLDKQIKDQVVSDGGADSEVKVLQWEVTMKKGEKKTLSYTYKAPQVSPQFYLLGPLRFFDGESKKVVFADTRNWQLAADAVAANIMLMEGGTDANKGTSGSTNPDIFWETPPFGSVVTSTTQVHSGNRSIKIGTGAGASGAILTTNTDYQAVKDSGTRISFWMYLDKWPTTGDGLGFMQVYDQGNTNYKFAALTFDDATHKIYLGEDFSTTGNTAIQLNRWYHITVSWTITSTSVNQLRLYVDGVLDKSGSNQTLFGTGSGCLRLGFVDSGAGSFVANANLYLDDIYIDDGSNLDDPGPVRIAHKRPFANGATNAWGTVTGAGSGYGSGHAPQVNEQPTNTATLISTGTGNLSENYEVEGPAVGDQDITGVRVLGYQGWVWESHTGTCTTPSITLNGNSSTFTSSTTTKLILKGAISTRYPESAAKIGLISCLSGGGTLKILEAGLNLAYLPATLPNLMRHGKYMDQNGQGEQPFSF